MNLEIREGADVHIRFLFVDSNGQPVDTGGLTVKLEVRPGPGLEPVYLSASTDTGEITLGGSDGSIDVNVAASATVALGFNVAVWDLLTVDGEGGATDRPLAGRAVYIPRVTV